MDRSRFSEEWIKNFKIVFGEEAERILDNIDNDWVHLMDILHGQINYLGHLLSLNSVTKQMENEDYKAVAEAYYKSLLVPALLDEVIKISQSRGL